MHKPWSVQFAVAAACLLSLLHAPVLAAGADGIMPDPDTVIKKILGLDVMAKNVCLIDSRQMVNAADLPGRLVAISADSQVPSDLLRYSFRKPGSKTVTQVNPAAAPIQVSRVESAQAKTGSLLNWFGMTMGKEDIAEIRTVPLPATSISVDNLDEDQITEKFSTVPESVRKGLGIVTDVIPYEVLAAVCKKTTAKAESGIWYIRLGKDTYSRQSDELRRYYLVAVYTPLTFYGDIGIVPGVKSSQWIPSQPTRSRSDALSLWLKENYESPASAGFAYERGVPGLDVPGTGRAKSKPVEEKDPFQIENTKPTNTSGAATVIR